MKVLVDTSIWSLAFRRRRDSLNLREKNTIKESVVAKKQEIEVQHLYGLDSEPDNSSIKINPNHEIKYSSFFDD